MSRLFREDPENVGIKGFLCSLFSSFVFMLVYAFGYMLGIVAIFLGLSKRIGMDREVDNRDEELDKIIDEMNKMGPNN